MTVFKANVMTPCRYLATKFYSMTLIYIYIYIYIERERERARNTTKTAFITGKFRDKCISRGVHF